MYTPMSRVRKYLDPKKSFRQAKLVDQAECEMNDGEEIHTGFVHCLNLFRKKITLEKLQLLSGHEIAPKCSFCVFFPAPFHLGAVLTLRSVVSGVLSLHHDRTLRSTTDDESLTTTVSPTTKTIQEKAAFISSWTYPLLI